MARIQRRKSPKGILQHQQKKKRGSMNGEDSPLMAVAEVYATNPDMMKVHAALSEGGDALTALLKSTCSGENPICELKTIKGALNRRKLAIASGGVTH